MVNRAMKEKGRWWTPFFYHWCRKAERGLFRGADGLLQTKSAIKKLAQRHVSIFWSTALIDWSKLEFALPTTPSSIAPHCEHSGSYPALAAVIGPSSRNNLPPAASVLVQSDLIYLADFWNFSTLQWTPPHSLDEATLPARQRLQVSREAVHKLIIHLLQQKALNTTGHVTSLEQARDSSS